MTKFQIDKEQNPLLVIASNRGPYAFQRDETGDFNANRGSGGLVTALAALAEQLDVLWVASALSEDDRAWAQQQQDRVTEVSGIQLRLIVSDEDAYYQFYNMIANPLLWFIQHGLWDMVRNPILDKSMWEAWEQGYRHINQQFADVIADSIAQLLADNPDRPVIVMPQDYHLYFVPMYLRQQVAEQVQIQPFVHIPWPGPDGWRTLPSEMRNDLLVSLLSSDRIGFQTRRDAFNFVQTARFYIEGAHSYGSRDSITYQNKRIGAYDYPISIDVDKVEELVNEPQAKLHKEQLISQVGDRKLILRVDRVEPSKNILRGLQAYRTLLEEHPEHHGNVTFWMLLVPSRMEVDEYKSYLRDIMAEAGMINASFSDEFWQPVNVILGNNYPRALAAMQLYDVLLVNPIADGMNLVAKEGALVNSRDGVLVLSEHAGVFYELGDHALTVSPFDIYSTAKAMHQALIMPRSEREQRAQAMKTVVREAGVREWFYNQVQDALTALSSHDKNDSTPDTPSTSTSDEAVTTSGVSSD
ncbi:MAG: alpha,alpha-trehalose-phosphate synthase (UDP-forming) [Anaerolineae bacterium]